MRIRWQNQVTELAKIAALCLLLLALVPLWAVHHVASTIRAWRKTGRDQPIERVSHDEVSLDEVMREGRPVIIEGLTSSLALSTVPDVAGLRRLAAERDGSFEVRSFKSHSPYFLYTGDYGAELDHVAHMSLHEFVEFMFEADDDPATCTYRLFSAADLDGAVGAIIDDISRGLRALTGRQVDRHASGIWVGSKGVVTPLHHDAWTGLLFQMAGSKRVHMFSPSDRPNLYFTSPFASVDRWSKLPGRSCDASLAEFPRFAKVTRYVGVLDEGEVLFIPPFWAHEIEALEANISIPFRFSTRAADRLNPGFLRPAFEVFHRKFPASRAVG